MIGVSKKKKNKAWLMCTLSKTLPIKFKDIKTERERTRISSCLKISKKKEKKF